MVGGCFGGGGELRREEVVGGSGRRQRRRRPAERAAMVQAMALLETTGDGRSLSFLVHILYPVRHSSFELHF